MATTEKEKVPLKKLVSIIGLTSIVGIIIFAISIPFSILMILSVDAVKALIEGIATLIGFFGLFAIYLLTSYDSRIDRIVEKIDYCEDKEKIKRLTGNFHSIKTKKQLNTVSILAGLISWVVSFFASLLLLSLLSFVDSTIPSGAFLLFIISLASSMFLFIGVFAIFAMVHRIGKEPDGYHFTSPSEDQATQESEQYII